MSSDNHDSSEKQVSDAQPSKYAKLLMILSGFLVVIALANTTLLVLNPTASHVEQFNENLKTDLAESIASVHKKIDGLRSAEVEWQRVLKKARDKPDAIYKIVETPDGLLTLTEIESPQPAQ